MARARVVCFLHSSYVCSGGCQQEVDAKVFLCAGHRVNLLYVAAAIVLNCCEGCLQISGLAPSMGVRMHDVMSSGENPTQVAALLFC